MTFRLLAVADGHAPAYSAKLVDPAAGPTGIKLKPHDLDRRDRALVFRGRVLDETGHPIPDAVVEPLGFDKGERGQFGGLTGFDPLALTNDRGEFRLGLPEKGLELYVQVSARFRARRNFSKLPADRDHDLTVVSGVTVTGRLVKDGKPLAGVAAGLVQRTRNVDTFVGEYSAATDAKGVFRIPNVPPDQDLVIYGLMDSLKAHGAVPARSIKTAATGSELDAGDLAIVTGHRLSGRVVLADGKPVPNGTRVSISRQEAWDSQQAVVDMDGAFAFDGLPSERYTLWANVRGYQVSPKNASFDLLNPLELLGRVDRDITGLRLLCEKGDGLPRRGEWNQKVSEEYDRRKNAPLRGARDPK